MIKGFESILLGSANAKELAKFYREVIGLKQTSEYEMGEEGEASNGYEFAMDGCSLYINDHSEVTGKATMPQRIILNLEVDTIESEVARLDAAGVKKVQDIYHLEGYGKIATFEDTDGNYFQFVQVRQVRE